MISLIFWWSNFWCRFSRSFFVSFQPPPLSLFIGFFPLYVGGTWYFFDVILTSTNWEELDPFSISWWHKSPLIWELRFSLRHLDFVWPLRMIKHHLWVFSFEGVDNTESHCIFDSIRTCLLGFYCYFLMLCLHFVLFSVFLSFLRLAWRNEENELKIMILEFLHLWLPPWSGQLQPTANFHVLH